MRTQSFIAKAKTAIDLIFDAADGRCLLHGHLLQRAWRDVAAINHHISLNFDAVMSMYGQFSRPVAMPQWFMLRFGA